MIREDSYTGCLLGGALGDALGAPVEFSSGAEIAARYGPRGVCALGSAYGRRGAVTDDTQMTLFTADGLIRATLAREAGDARALPAHFVARAYQRWLATQTGGRAPDWAIEASDWLFADRRLHYRRAPGNTCLSALAAISGPGERAANDSKGCGGVMRVAPVGLFAAHQGREAAVYAFQLACDIAAVTHGHITGQLPAGVLAAMVVQLVHGDTVKEAWRAAREVLVTTPGHEDTLSALDAAERLAAVSAGDPSCVAELGEGWVAEEALAIALYCALSCDDFEDAVSLAVSHGGDSDSTGAIAGHLRGAAAGASRLPAVWLDELELVDIVRTLASDLQGLAYVANAAPALLKRYGLLMGTSKNRCLCRYPPELTGHCR